MSKLKRILTILLAAFILCLPACGESTEKDTTAQNGTEPSGTADTSVGSSSIDDPRYTIEIGDIPDSDGVDDYYSGSNSSGSSADNNSAGSGDASSQHSSADNAGAQENDGSGSDDSSSQNEVGQKSDPDPVSPIVNTPQEPQEVDNAEVNINDL